MPCRMLRRCIASLVLLMSLFGVGCARQSADPTSADYEDPVAETQESEQQEEPLETDDQIHSEAEVVEGSDSFTHSSYWLNLDEVIEGSGGVGFVLVLAPDGDAVQAPVYYDRVRYGDVYSRNGVRRKDLDESDLVAILTSDIWVDGYYYPTLVRSNGEQLILINDTSASIYPIVDEGFWQGISSDAHADSFPIHDFDEIEGVELDSILTADELSRRVEQANAFLSGYGVAYDAFEFGNNVSDSKSVYMWRSPEPGSLTVGYYRGTDFQEGNIWIYDRYIFIPDSEVTATEANVTRTKEGYFSIDISSLDEGKYVIHCASGYYPIEIVSQL